MSVSWYMCVCNTYITPGWMHLVHVYVCNTYVPPRWMYPDMCMCAFQQSKVFL